MTQQEQVEARQHVVSILGREVCKTVEPAVYRSYNEPVAAIDDSGDFVKFAAAFVMLHGNREAFAVWHEGSALYYKGGFVKPKETVADSTVDRLFGQYVANNAEAFLKRLGTGETPAEIRAEIRANLTSGIMPKTGNDVSEREGERIVEANRAHKASVLKAAAARDQARIGTTG